MISIGRFQFIPFWRLTRWGFLFNNGSCSALRLNHGCDEWHNPSRWIIVPLVGEFVWFRTLHRDGPEHLWGSSGGVHEGYVDPDCEICQEILHDFEETSG